MVETIRMWFSPQVADETLVLEIGLKSRVGVWKQRWPFGKVIGPLLSWKMEIVLLCVRGEEKMKERN